TAKAAKKQPPVVRPSSVPTSPQEPLGPKSSRERYGVVDCAYCEAAFSSAARREEHVQSEHVADGSDSEAKQLLKPLIRIKGIIFEQKRYRRVAIPENRVEQPPNTQQQEIGSQARLPAASTTARIGQGIHKSPSGHQLVVCPD